MYSQTVTDALTKVLYIHPYSDSYNGAEELDIICGLNILKEISSIEVYRVAVDLNDKSLKIDFVHNLKSSNLKIIPFFRYWINFISAPDNTLRQAFSFKNSMEVMELCKSLGIDVVFTNTSSTFLFGKQKKIRHIHRSVSFEPVYVTKSVENPVKKMIHVFLKFLTVLKELHCDLIFTISPRDDKYYNHVSFISCKRVKTQILPLRQLAFTEKYDSNQFGKDDLNIGFLGSTYNVLHNERSLRYLLETLSHDFLDSNHMIFNVYGKKIMKEIKSRYTSNRIRFHDWIPDIKEIYNLNQVFLVPNFLGSGMQSKVFEPLVAGRILICDPRVLSGYDFKPNYEFIPATNTMEFINSLKWIKLNFYESSTMSERARIRSLELFGPEIIKSTIYNNLRVNDGHT